MPLSITEVNLRGFPHQRRGPEDNGVISRERDRLVQRKPGQHMPGQRMPVPHKREQRMPVQRTRVGMRIGVHKTVAAHRPVERRIGSVQRM